MKQNAKVCIRTAAENGSFHVFTYCGILKGYETSKVLLHDILYQIVSSEESSVFAERGNHFPPHVSLPLLGRFNSGSKEDQCRVIDIFWETKSVLQPVIWAQICIVALMYHGITWGWSYQKQYDGIQMRMSDFADIFFSILLDIQQDRPYLIANDIYDINDCGLSMSERRGATTIAQSAEVS